MQAYNTLNDLHTIRQFIFISLSNQKLFCFVGDVLYKFYPVSTAKNGPGEKNGSQCTPRGWHRIYSKIGMNAPINSVFACRQPTGEIYNEALAACFPDRDWILTRIIQLDGLEKGRNRGGEVDSLNRFIYIHGTPANTDMSKPGSHGCIRMKNHDMIELMDWVMTGALVCIE